jgi:hypothetical protein
MASDRVTGGVEAPQKLSRERRGRGFIFHKIHVSFLFMPQNEGAPPRRGRPPKFGRPAQLVTLTLPRDVLDWLKTLHADPAWAIVKLFERSARRTLRTASMAELAQLPGRRALILVNADALKRLPGVSVIPLADGRGFLALEAGRGVADLEIAVIDGLEAPSATPAERAALQELRARLREWRQSGLRFESRAIILAQRGPHAEPARPLTAIKPRRRARGIA